MAAADGFRTGRLPEFVVGAPAVPVVDGGVRAGFASASGAKVGDTDPGTVEPACQK